MNFIYFVNKQNNQQAFKNKNNYKNKLGLFPDFNNCVKCCNELRSTMYFLNRDLRGRSGISGSYGGSITNFLEVFKLSSER